MPAPADPALDALIAVIRKRCKPALWSQGVTMARGGGVAVESSSPDEIVLRVRAPGKIVPATAVLYPTGNEWECDCPSRMSPCEHVAAAAISLSAGERPADAGQPEAAATGAPVAVPVAPAAALGARVIYRFERLPDGLRLSRFLRAAGGEETALAGTLAALVADPAKASRLQLEEADLRADRLLERATNARVAVAPTKLDALLQVLAGTADRVFLDGVAVAVSDEELRPQATLVDARAGRDAEVRLTIAPDPRLRAVVAPGVALCEDEGRATLNRLTETELTGVWLQNLPVKRAFRSAELGELLTVVLPDLARRTNLDVRSGRLPPVARDLKPRVVLQMDHLDGAQLTVLPTLVYGAPPAARVDNGKLVYLRGPVPVRDTAAEQRAIEKLRQDLDLLPGRRTTFGAADAPRFVEKLKRWRGDLSGAAAGIVKPSATLAPRLQVTTAGDPAAGTDAVRFELTFEVQRPGGASGPEAGTVDAGAVVRAWQEGLGIVPLLDGGWAALPHDWLRRHGQRIADLLAAREDDGRLARHALPALAELCTELEHPAPPGLDRLAPLVQGFERLPEVALPGDVRADLRAYQREGVRWLAFLKSAGLGGILADDMGLGKTLQAMCVFDQGGQTLVVCPTSVIHNWAAELARFRPGLKVCLYHGAARKLDPAADVTVTSYALLRLDAAKLAGPPAGWRTVVLDEAQAIKNPDSQTARAAYAVRASFRLALTGTPVENRLEELWSLVHFTNRGLLGGRGEFADRFARPIAEGRRDVAADLRRRLKPFILRRLKQDVAPELPPRTDAVLRVELGDAERAVYDAVRAATRSDVLALLADGKGVMQALEALLRLRQAACHPALVPGQKAPTSSKVETLVAALETAVAENHKALVFSQWTSLLDLIEPALARAELPFTRLDGATRDRGAVVERFQAEDGPPVMLVSLKAGGSGLNLTAADHVFLCDPWWNPAVEAQAADRTHRIGQTRPVFVYRLVSADTVEEKILVLQDSKRALMDAALADGAAAAGLTKDDLLALLA
ncbi:MAG TPA: DEAD/DEAH box helicase [Polyangia bacterium]|nr:DEAD/DEAH box helicase [Polyangia bacterium]